MDKRVVLITGADGGLGRAMATALASAGHNVVLSARGRTTLEKTANALANAPGRTATIAADMAKPGEAERLADEAIAAFGHVDMLVNNAGINMVTSGAPAEFQEPGRYWSADRALIECFFAVNVIPGMVLANRLVPSMIERGWGRVVATSTSLDSMLSLRFYGASKAALEADTANMATKLQGTGVTANVLLPGGIVATAMAEGFPFARDKMLPASVMAVPIVFLASDDAGDFNARRIIAVRWNKELAPRQAAIVASDPIAWTGVGAKALIPE